MSNQGGMEFWVPEETHVLQARIMAPGSIEVWAGVMQNWCSSLGVLKAVTSHGLTPFTGQVV